MSKICEQASRFDDMVICLRKAIKQNAELSPEERNLLALAYKQLLSERRVAWRILSSAEQREEKKGSRDHAKLVSGYRRLVEREITDICEEKVQVLDSQLIPNAQGVEEQVFYFKQKADYHRYLAEVNTSEIHKDNAQESYSKGSELAQRSLPNTHPLKLGLALNYSVFTNEIMRQHEKGVDIAKRCFDSAVSELESLDEESYREATALMQLLRDNLSMWSEESRAGDGDEAT